MKKLIFLILIFASIVLAGCKLAESNNRARSVTYSVTGSYPTASLTYENSSGGTNQADVSLPWSYSFTTGTAYTFLYISAQLDGTGSVTATITVDGSILQAATSSGTYVIATADGSVNDL